MYSNFSALNTNMAIYLSPFQRHLTFSIHLTATLLYTWLRIFFREKITRSPSPVPTKLLLSTEHNVEALVLFVSPVVKKKKAWQSQCCANFSALVCLESAVTCACCRSKNHNCFSCSWPRGIST